MPLFAATMQQIAAGSRGCAIDAAVKTIAGWEAHLARHEGAGARAMVRDLVRLRQLLQATQIDGHAVQQMLARLAKETIALAAEAPPARAAQLRQLGAALGRAG